MWVRILVVMMLAAVLCGCAGDREQFTFVQMCDTQLGFGGYKEDVARFRQAVKQINALKPDFVVICGDLVNSATTKSFADFNDVKSGFAVPCHCAPGNHDVSNSPSSLKRYRELIGKDYFSFEHKGFTFVIANSQMWKGGASKETGAQDAWLKATLAAASQKRHGIFLVVHQPLFVKDPDEKDEYYNIPLAKRRELLDLFKKHGVVAVLAGHTHKTMIQDYHGIQMVNGATTSRNFDKRPFGFRLWHVGRKRPYKHEHVSLEMK